MSGNWPEDCIGVKTIALPKKSQAKKCSDHRKNSLNSRTEDIVPRILTKRLESKIEKFIDENNFRFRKCKGTRNDIGLSRVISEVLLKIFNR